LANNSRNDIPQGFVAALNHFGGTFIMIFSSMFELIVVIVWKAKCFIDNTGRSPDAAKTPAAEETTPPNALAANATIAATAAVVTAAAPAGAEAAPAAEAKAKATAVASDALAQSDNLSANPVRKRRTVAAAAAPAPIAPPPPEVVPRESVPERAPQVDHSPPSTLVKADRISETGTLVWHGMKKHRRTNGEEYACYTVMIDDALGNRKVLQGKELESAIALSEASRGSRIKLELKGKTFVRVLNGKSIYRNEWTATKLY
jgi:hypothetical protein